MDGVLKDYDYVVQYHPDKANVVVDALSRKEPICMDEMMLSEWKLVETFNLMIVGVSPKGNSTYVASLTI